MLAATCFAQSNVVTLTQQDIAGLLASACGPQAIPQKKVHVHRNEAGNMLYVVAGGQAEALIYAQQQACNPLSPETIDLWRRASDGAVTAQLAHRYDGERLLMEGSSDGISGDHFDVSDGGQYMVVSHGDVSSVSPLDRPYMRTIELQMDARRIFMRSDGGLLVVGSNKASNRLEAVPISLQGGTAVASAPIPVPGVPAGVLVLDYNNKTDELLLGGVDASGTTSFAIANLATGQGRLVNNAKPGAVTALFISDPALLAKLTGQPVPAGTASQPAPGAQGQPAQPAQPRGGFSLNPMNWFGRK
jgi:hypothetical protein